jgi:hypothetical protein
MNDRTTKTAIAPYGAKQPIFDRRRTYEREELEARKEALREHTEKFRAVERGIQAECEASGGHEMDYDRGDFAARQLFTGAHGMHCKWCRVFAWEKISDEQAI